MLSGPQKSVWLGIIAQEGNVRTFVETGTADHTNILRVAPWFDEVFTIELDHGFYLQALWGTRHLPQVTCIYGDSAEIVEHLAYRLEGDVLWWLDAHYCGGVRGPDGDTPVAIELAKIFQFRQRQPNHILIDDARLFGSDPAYPSVEWVQHFVDQQPCGDLYQEVYVKHDIIHIIPKAAP